MKVKILEPVMLPGGVGAKPGEIVELPEMAAFNIISVGRGVELNAQAEEAAPVETREPQPETRDPELSGGGKTGKRRG